MGVRPFKGTGPEIAMQHLHAEPAPLRRQGLNIPLQVEQVILKAMNKDPRERFSSIRAFADALQAASQADSSLPTAKPDLVAESVSTVPLAPSALSPLQLAISGLPKDELKPLGGEVSFLQQRKQAQSSSQATQKRFFVSLTLLLLSALLLSSGALMYLAYGKSLFSGVSHSPRGTASPAPRQSSPGGTLATSPTPLPTMNPLATATAVSVMQYYNRYASGAPTQEYTPANLNGWTNGSPGYGSCENNSAQGYDIVPKGLGDTQVCVAPPSGLSSGNFAVQVALTVNHGTGAALGFGFTLPDVGTFYNGDYYYFGFCRVESGAYCPAGNIFLDHAQNGELTQCMGPGPNADYSTRGTTCSETSSAINTPPGATNVLTVVVIQGTIYLYINAAFVMAFQPAAPVNYSPYGQVGVAAVEGGQPTDVTFQSLKIWSTQQ